MGSEPYSARSSCNGNETAHDTLSERLMCDARQQKSFKTRYTFGLDDKLACTKAAPMSVKSGSDGSSM